MPRGLRQRQTRVWVAVLRMHECITSQITNPEGLN